MNPVVVAVLVTAAAIVVSALIAARRHDIQPVPRGGRPWEAPRSAPYSSAITGPGAPRLSRSVLLGALSLAFLWFPLAGIPLALAGIGLGLSDIAAAARRAFARTGVYLGLTALTAAVALSPIGTFLGSQGHPW